MTQSVLGTSAAYCIVSLLMCAAASAHVFSAPTNLSIQVKDSIVFGKLASRPECRGGQTIRLLIDGQVIDSTTTDAQGRYTFSFTPESGVRIQTRFDGSRSGHHPHRHVCQPSTSRLVTHGAVLGTGGTTSGGADPGATAASGADVRVPVAIAVIGVLLGASLLLIVRRRSD